ncbi:MAG: hypothetical protein L6R41_004859 [Letrouitia leprolyta]|nr:MAG: hypothetical protein L6R41_004859 [Letrouitia leprolyta]
MAPSRSLPFSLQFANTDEFVESLLSFVTSSKVFQDLCGGVHMLEFLTRDPDLYGTLIPEDWQRFLILIEIPEILDLLMREDLSLLDTYDICTEPEDHISSGRSRILPPRSLVEYIRHVRSYSLDRCVKSPGPEKLAISQDVLPKHVAVGMKPKKIHEVSSLARYVERLSSELSFNYSYQISHFVDFGSGQNYLGRALASPPYAKRIIAIESKPLNIDGARKMDVTAKLARKEVILRNKKKHRSQFQQKLRLPEQGPASYQPQAPETPSCNHDLTATIAEKQQNDEQANIHYVQSVIQDGKLDLGSWRLPPSSASSDPNLMVVSLHSCGNLLHHGLRSLTLNPSVRAVALVGCCYNLLTERLPPPLTQQPSLRSNHPLLEETSSTYDAHGFPMSERFLNYDHPCGPGIRFNITARMMAVQAPQNWTEKDRNSFFTRHFYRALFQKILVDKGVIAEPKHSEDEAGQRNPASYVEDKPQIILGSLRKQCYTSFTAYARAAITKLKSDPARSEKITRCMGALQDEEIEQYEKDYAHKKKELSIVWSLMAFSAGVVESAIVVDRWQWLWEQKEVKECWVESIFDYAISPRNLVVVGIR